jgi:hypothetical protein
MNCTELDSAFEDAGAFFTESEGGFVAAVSALAILSCLLLAKGDVLVRPAGAVIAALASAGAVFLVSALAEGVPCMARVAVAATAGVLAAVLVLCLFKTGLFVLGGAGFGTVGHFVYEALPVDDAAASVAFFGRSGWYYLVVLGTAAVGAAASCSQRTHFVRLSSSLLGGGGVAWTVHLVAERGRQGGEQAVPSLVLLLIMLVATAAGVGTQYALQRRAEAKAERRRGHRDGERV